MASRLNPPRYSVELWDSDGIFIADVSAFTSDLKYTVKLNTAEDLSFTLDIKQLDNMLNTIGADITNVIEPYVTDVKIRRNGVYLFGTEVVEIESRLGDEYVMDVRCNGYLNMFKDRYISASDYPGDFENKTYAELAWTLIDSTQSKTNGSFNVTLGSDTASASQDNTRTRQGDYDNQEVKAGIVNLTQLSDDNFDFWFDYNRAIYFATKMGNDRTYLTLEYPGNIKSLSMKRSATTLYNEITAIGDGSGETVRLSYTTSDNVSILTYKMRERVESFSSITNVETLQEHADGDLPSYSNMYVVPDITMHDNSLDLSEVWIGDSINVNINYAYINFNDVYRINALSVDVDKNFAETVVVTLGEYNGE